MSQSHSFQSVVMQLEKFWADYGCLIWQPYNEKVGAGTMNPATTLRVLGPEPWNVAYVEPSIRPDDGRYGENPNRMQQHHQYQVILKPDPGDPQEVYLASLEAIGIDPREHDLRFVEDNWESPAIGAWGLGWEVWLDGQEITQFTYFQQAGGLQLDPVSVEITYGLDRILIALQRIQGFTEIKWNDKITAGDVNLQLEQEYSRYYFETADVERLRTLYNLYEAEAEAALHGGLVLPAYDYVLKCSHTFNILDTRGAIGVTERAGYFKRMRGLSRQVAEAYVAQRQRLEFPLLEASSETESTATVAVEALPAPAADAAYLLEIGVEELPAADLDTLMEQIREKTPALLAAHRLPHGDIRVYGTPRRLAVLVDAIPPQQPDSEELVRGPAVKVAFDSDGEPTKAALGFARGKGVPVQDLERREMDGGEYVVAVVRAAGRPAAAVLAELAPALIAELKVARSMRWRPGDGVSFSRPIRWLVSLLADAVVPFEYAGVRAGRDTRTIRPHGGQALSVPDAAAYLSLMEENAIMVDRDRRRARVVAAAERLAAEVGGEIPADPALADEVANLVESPTAFRGQFAAEFLQLPKEVLISVMRKHQRYFPVVKDGKLLPYFVGVRNGDREHLDVVTAGNETVIRARFADARFFVRADMQKPLAEFRPLLARLTFHEQLGTMLDKADRIEQLAMKLGAELGLSDAASATARRAAQLAKADLATSMVVEMTSLQGVMGREYALHSGESADVAAAIEQHYWPVGAGGVLPGSPAATAVALADRFDSLAGLFGAGLAPTGSADPFGLRRAALGIVQILIGNEIDFDVRAALQAAATLQPIDVPAAVVAGAGEFVTRRLRSVLQEASFRHDVVEAVARAQGHNPHRAGQAAAQLAEWVVRPDWDTTLDNYARCVRITRGLETRLPVTSDLFVEDAERSLRAALESAAEQISPASSVDEFLTAFGALVPSIMRFFDEVLVMADDEAVRKNRLGLLQSVAALADGIVDLSALEGF